MLSLATISLSGAVLLSTACTVEGVIGKEPPETDGTTGEGTGTHGSTHGNTGTHGSTGGSTGMVCSATLPSGACNDCLVSHCCEVVEACLAQEGCACVLDCLEQGGTVADCEAGCPAHNGHHDEIIHCQDSTCAAACN